MRILVSVRDVAEALAAAGAGADFIDLKEPRAGALGGLDPIRIREVVAALRGGAHAGLPISATIGDFDARELARIEAQMAAVAACGVDYVKVGIAGDDAGAIARLLDRLAAAPWAVVPVFIADRGLDLDAVALACGLPFPALMADTQDKLAGSLFDCSEAAVLARFVTLTREADKLVGLAGALRSRHLPQLTALAPDFAGFRSAVCEGDRSARLDPARVRALRLALGAPEARAEPVTG